MKLFGLSGAAITAAILASPAMAVGVSGSGALGKYGGDLAFNVITDTEAVIVLELTNNSAPANGGFITGFVLNNPQNLITNVSLSPAGLFQQVGLGAGDDISGSPFGDFDFGAALGGNFLGGGNPGGGIAVGDTVAFTFNVTGSGFLGIDEDDFLNELSANAGGGGPQSLVVRFRGFEDDGSDKVPRFPDIPVPAPGALGLLGFGLLAAAGMRRRRA